MKTSTPAFTVALLLIALLGLGFGLLCMATRVFGDAKTYLEATGVAYLPLLIGVVVLGSATIVLAVDDSRKHQLAMLERIAAAVERVPEAK